MAKKYIFLLTYKVLFEDGRNIEGEVRYPTDQEEITVSGFEKWKEAVTTFAEKQGGGKVVQPPILLNSIRLINDEQK